MSDHPPTDRLLAALAQLIRARTIVLDAKRDAARAEARLSSGEKDAEEAETEVLKLAGEREISLLVKPRSDRASPHPDRYLVEIDAPGKAAREIKIRKIEETIIP